MSIWGPHFGSKNVTTHLPLHQSSPTSQSGKQKQETPKQKLEMSSRSSESGGNSTKKPRANVNIPIMAWQEEPQQLPMGSSSDGGVLMLHSKAPGDPVGTSSSKKVRKGIEQT